MKHRTYKGWKLTSAVASLAIAALTLGGCAASEPNAVDASEPNAVERDDELSVPFLAIDEEWQTALADIEKPFNLVFEVSAGAGSPGSESIEAFRERVDERSGGKVNIEIVYSFAVSGSPLEAEDALQDGRVDIANALTPYLKASEYPVAGTIGTDLGILFPAAPVGGFLAGVGAASETLLATPAYVDDFAAKGLELHIPYSTASSAAFFCSEPLTSLDDIQGKQVRVSTGMGFRQVEALGATPVSISILELFESVQRGMVDCVLSAIPVINNFDGLAEMLPYTMFTEDANWGPTVASMVSGTTTWNTLPLAVQQLVYDSAQELLIDTLELIVLSSPVETLEAQESVGGEWIHFDGDVNAKLREVNDEIVAEWRANPLIDGDAFMDAWDSNLAEWLELVEEADLSMAPPEDTAGWSAATPDWDAFAEIYYERISTPNRPGAERG